MEHAVSNKEAQATVVPGTLWVVKDGSKKVYLHQIGVTAACTCFVCIENKDSGKGLIVI
jgi:hypothetical protein